MLLVARALNLYCAGLALGIPAALALVILPPLRRGAPATGASIAVVLNRSIAILWAVIAVTVVSGAVWLLLEGAAMSGRGLAAVTSPAIIETVLWRTRFGFVLLVRLA